MTLARALFAAWLLVASTTGAVGYYHDTLDALGGPSPADRLCDDRLPGAGWDGATAVTVAPDAAQRVTCTLTVSRTVRVNASG